MSPPVEALLIYRCPECGRARTPEPGAVSKPACMSYGDHRRRTAVTMEPLQVVSVRSLMALASDVLERALS